MEELLHNEIDNFVELADGTKIDPTTGKVFKQKKTGYTLPTMLQMQSAYTDAKRKVEDLPALPSTMNPIGVVLSYTLFGLNNNEIAIATNLSVEQVTRIKEQPEFDMMREEIVQQVLLSQSSEVKNLFELHSRDAVETLVDIMHNGEFEMNKTVAAKDILDRAGHRPADVVIEKREKREAELTIRYITKDANAAVDNLIDITPNEDLTNGFEN